MTATPEFEGEMPRRRKRRDPVPSLPRRVRACVGDRAVAEIAFGDGALVVPGSVVWLADPAKVSGEDRERAAADAVRKAGLDPKTDHDRVYDALWGLAPKRA